MPLSSASIAWVCRTHVLRSAPSPNATVTTSQAISLLWNWLTNSGDPIEPANVSPVLTPLAPEQVAYHLTPPNTQGDFDHVQEAGRAIGQAAHGARLALFITEKVTFDTFVERVRRQSRERDPAHMPAALV